MHHVERETHDENTGEHQQTRDKQANKHALGECKLAPAVRHRFPRHSMHREGGKHATGKAHQRERQQHRVVMRHKIGRRDHRIRNAA